MYIGTHISFAKGFYQMGKDALEIGANTFQYFSRNPRGTKAKALDLKDLEKLRLLMKEHGFGPLVIHAPYTLNPCSGDPHLRELAAEMIGDDLDRLEHLPENLYNFHPGSHVGQGAETAIEQIAEMLNTVLTESRHSTVLLETMSGKGTEVGRSFRELAEIIERVEKKEQIGVCMDSCHLYSAGYDIVHDLDGVLEEFDRIIGLKRLKAFHLNDSQTAFRSSKDRHAGLGEGTIGLPALVRLVTHPQLCHLPFILETPHELPGHKEEIAMLKALCQEKEAVTVPNKVKILP